MRISGRLAGIGGALLLCQLTGPAFADPTPPTPVPAQVVVDCPPTEPVAAALGREVTLTVAQANECQYSVSGAGLVVYRLESLTMAKLRSAAEAQGNPITEVPALAPDAFATTTGNSWVLRFPVGSGAATLVVPAGLQSGATHLAEEMLAATSAVAEVEPPATGEIPEPGMPSTGN